MVSLAAQQIILLLRSQLILIINLLSVFKAREPFDLTIQKH